MYKKFLGIIIAFISSILLILPNQIVNAASFDQRLAGQTRYETAVKIAQQGWTSSDYAVVASGEGFADALSAAPLAKKYNGPILLTGRDTLDSNTKSELQNLGVKNVFLIGGTGSISDNVKSELESMNIAVTRISGKDRFETSLEVAKNLGDINGIVVANAYGFADALSMAPIAASQGMAIILTSSDSLSSDTQTFLNSVNYDKSYIVGGTGVVNDSVASQLKNVVRLSGSSRYETNAAVLKQFADNFSYDKVYVASGENYPDALSGCVLASLTNSPVILVSDSVDTSVMDAVKAKHDSYQNVIALGGASVVPDSSAIYIVEGSTTPPHSEPPPINAQVTANVNDASPIKDSTIYLTVTGQVGDGVTAVCHYKTTDSTYTGTIESNGQAVIPIKIGRATSGYTVVIDVAVGSSNVETSFTPQ